jgi:hypothetical protein
LVTGIDAIWGLRFYYLLIKTCFRRQLASTVRAVNVHFLLSNLIQLREPAKEITELPLPDDILMLLDTLVDFLVLKTEPV